MSFNFKSKYNIDDLREIMALLRSPQGCPWDIKQTHQSIRSNLIEETYEVLDAIDNNDTENLREELGDLLLQVIFHSIMEEEIGTFDFDDVCNDICQKLIVRHPHVFADVVADTPEEVLRNWDEIKRQGKGQKSVSESMGGIPKGLPALIRAAKVQKKASGVGFDWDNVDDALGKVFEEAQEVRDAIASGDGVNIAEELGDLLFATVNVTRFVKVDAEEALTSASDKFVARFTRVEQLAKERGIDMNDATLEQLDALWDEVKASEQ
ncbi:MAG: nucleoside triphosphate pyrophosphohydrolase [Clostridia bacterium]|nr:nucleoside triphosphate pyrophosphohydrolase [Clostridia bacterium]